MLNQEVEKWISSLREDDQLNTRNFLECSLEYLMQHVEFLQGSGFYIVGSALSHRWAYYKGNYGAGKDKLEEELIEKLKERFGEETLMAHNKAWRERRRIPESDEIESMLDKGFIENHRKLFERENYGDVDLIISGLSRSKSDSELEIWQKFADNLRVKFPDSKHPENFTSWEVYDIGDGHRRWVVEDYILKIPSSKNPTEIHFMIFMSDERFGITYREQRGEYDTLYFLDHWPSSDVSLEQWKEQQKKDKLPYLTILEF